MLEKLPKTLTGIIRFFADPQVCIDFVATMRWEDSEPVCHHCHSKGAYYLASRKIYKCKVCRKQFSVKMGTIFEESGVALDKWLIAIWMIVNAKNGISSYELGKAIGVKQRSAWFMQQRIRVAMEQGSIEKFSGETEIDESYIGGQVKNMHKDRRQRLIKKGHTIDLFDHKTAVLGMLERKGKIRAKVVKRTRREDLIPLIEEQIEVGANVFTDEAKVYHHLHERYIHETVNHAIEYVRGNAHTNSIENFWSLLKRTIKGTYVSIQAEHLQKYVEEQCFRYNTREMDDRGRFLELMKSISGKRLTWEKLTDYEI